MTTKQKTIVVTGASQAIGAAAPSLFLDRGYKLEEFLRTLAEITLNARLV